MDKGGIPHTRHVRGSNYNLISVFPDRLSGRAIIISGTSQRWWPTLYQSGRYSTPLWLMPTYTGLAASPLAPRSIMVWL